jgi:hypothetical protein
MATQTLPPVVNQSHEHDCIQCEQRFILCRCDEPDEPFVCQSCEHAEMFNL